MVLDAFCTPSYIRFCFYLASLRSRYYENIIQMALALQVALGVVLDACCTSSYIRFCFYLGSLRSRYYENIIQMALVLQVALGWFWMVSLKGFTFWFL